MEKKNKIGVSNCYVVIAHVTFSASNIRFYITWEGKQKHLLAIISCFCIFFHFLC